MSRFIGITGLPGSGKEVVKDLLLEYFERCSISTYYWSMSNDVRNAAKGEFKTITRETISHTSRLLKERFGPAVLAIRALDNIEERFRAGDRPRVIVLEAIKNSHEISFFRRKLGRRFRLLGIEAPSIDMLIDRIMTRNRSDEDPDVLLSREAARMMIMKECGKPRTRCGFDIGYCLSIADFRISNVSNLDTLKSSVVQFAATLESTDPKTVF